MFANCAVLASDRGAVSRPCRGPVPGVELGDDRAAHTSRACLEGVAAWPAAGGEPSGADRHPPHRHGDAGPLQRRGAGGTGSGSDVLLCHLHHHLIPLREKIQILL